MGEKFRPQCYEVLSSSCQRVKKTFWTIFFLHFFSFFLSLAFALDSIHLMLGDEPKCKFWMTLRYFILTRWLSTGSSNWKCDMQNWNPHLFLFFHFHFLPNESMNQNQFDLHASTMIFGRERERNREIMWSIFRERGGERVWDSLWEERYRKKEWETLER